MQLNGSEIVIACLKEQGVDTVFGYPGGAILNIYDELYKHSHEIRHVLTSHEQGAAHAADGYARATGKVGVCMATSGPGATNLVTGIATAYMDSVPVVAITANVGKALLGKDSFQEVDIAGIVTPITKYSFIVKDVEDIAPTLRRAFSIAQKDRPGPVLVDITKDATANVTEYQPVTPEKIRFRTDTIVEEDLQKAVELINHAKRPYIFVGGGAVISNAWKEVREFVGKVHAPVADTLMGKGVFDGTDPLYTGMLGMHGTKTSNFGVTESDLLIVLGSRFSDRVIGNAKKFARNAKIIHIDIDPAEINKNIHAHLRLIGDIKDVLKRINPLLENHSHEEWLAHIAKLQKTYPLRYNPEGLTGPYIIEQIYEATGGDAIITTEVGQHQMWAAQYFKYSMPRMLLTSGGLGTMGYGLGASMGAKVAFPEKTVFNIAGDGCFRMNMNEIATAVRENIPIIEVIINNHVLGMVRQWQTLYYGKRYSNTVLNDSADFAKFAESMGAVGIRVTKKEEVMPAIKKAMELKRPVVLDCIIDSDDKVFPMVSPGTPIDEAFDGDDLKKRNADN